jgi:hypothetical protein
MNRFFSSVFTHTWRNKGLVNRWGGLTCGMAFVFNIEFNRAFVAISLDEAVAALRTSLPILGLLTGFGGVQ